MTEKVLGVLKDWIQSVLVDCNEVVRNMDEPDWRIHITFGCVLGNLQDMEKYIIRNQEKTVPSSG